MSKLPFRLQKEYFATITDYVKFNYLKEYPEKVVELSSLNVTKVKPTYRDDDYSTVITGIENLDKINGVIIRRTDLLEGTSCVTWGIQMTRPFLIFTFNGINLFNYNYISSAGVKWDTSLDTWMPYAGAIDFNTRIDIYNVLRDYPACKTYHLPNLDLQSYTNAGFGDGIPSKQVNVPYIHTGFVSNNPYGKCMVKAIYANLDNSFLIQGVSYTKQELMLIIETLQPTTTTKTLTVGSKNLALLTDEDKKIATDKGWTLA